LKPLKLRARKNWLWLWILPTVLSWLLVSLAGRSGGGTFRVELAAICSCSCFCGFALAVKSYSTFKERLCVGLFFTGGSLSVISSLLFMGCLYQSGPSAAQLREERVRLEADAKTRTAKQIVPRDSQADPSMLNLAAFYDSPLFGQTGRNRPGLRALEPGTHAWNGIKFDVRGTIMAQRQPGGKITGIPVGQKCSGLAFLHGTYPLFVNYPGNSFSRFVIHFANGHAETIPLVFGKDIGPSRDDNNRPALGLASTNSVVWAERVSTNGTVRPVSVFYIKQWKNPFPAETVKTVDFIPSASYANVVLAAITVLPASLEGSP
jgi:hypothetical protein